MRWISLLQKVRDGELNDELMSWIKTSQIDFFFFYNLVKCYYQWLVTLL